MGGRELIWYVIFSNHTQGLRLNDLLQAAGLRSTIVPTPRRLSTSCGISLMIAECDLPAIREVVTREQVTILDIAALEADIDPRRDRYC